MVETLTRPEGAPAPSVRTIEFTRPLQWLARGWKDLRRALPASLFYGLVFAFAGAWATWVAWGRPHLVTALFSGFFLVGPFLLMGVYDLSRQLEAGGRPDLAGSLGAWRANAESIGLYGFLLAFALISWERISAILFALLLPGDIASVEKLAAEIVFSGRHLELLAAWAGIGALLAVLVFALSVVSVPMLLDRRTDVITALLTSLAAVRANPAPLALWAVLIVALSAVGFLTWFAALVVILPWLGHATWHAYRDLVE